MTPFIRLLEASRRILQERRHGAKNPHAVIMLSNSFLDELKASPPAEVAGWQAAGIIEQIVDGQAPTIRGIPLYFDDQLDRDFIVLKGSEASQRLTAIHKRNEERRS